MGSETVMIVPATVPSATVLRADQGEPAVPVLVSADPASVPVAEPVRLVSDVITAEQIEQLRAENAELRRELERARTS